MKAITLWQPWASLLVAGEKKVETRSWRFPYKMPIVLAIHAAKKWDNYLAELAWSQPFHSALQRCGLLNGRGSIPRGAIVGIVQLTSCRPTDDFGQTVSTTEMAFGDYTAGRWAWLCSEFFQLPEPIPCRGRQGVFDWEPPEGLELPEWATKRK